MYKALHLSPMIPSFNIEETISFFQNILDFEVGMKEATYAIIYKDNLTIHILPAGHEIGQVELYLQVDDVDQLWENIKDKLLGFKFKAPFDRVYGMREVHIRVPQTQALLFIGQKIDK